MKKIAILTGAGISAESDISTFRDANGLWEGHDIMEVASPEGFAKNPKIVLEFYNQRRHQILNVEPNAAHKALAALQEDFDTHIITQNVDDLHERAGSKKVLHLHGELLKARSIAPNAKPISWEKDINLGDKDSDGKQLRPHIVWFGEEVPNIEPAIKIIEKADIIIVVGTSMQVYPAASLIHYAQHHTPIYFIDPKPQITPTKNLHIFAEKASTGVPKAIDHLKKNH